MNTKPRFKLTTELSTAYQKCNNDWLSIADHLLEVFDISVKGCEPMPHKYEKGDKARVIGDSTNHGMDMNTVVEVKSFDKTHIYATSSKYQGIYFFNAPDLEPIPTTEPIELRPIQIRNTTASSINSEKISELERVVRLLIERTK